MMKYYAAIKWYELLIPTTTWMTLKNIMLIEKSQIHRTYCYRFHLYQMPGKGKPIETASQLVIASGWR